MNERRKVLVVDDDKTWQVFLSAVLTDDYNIITAFDGDIALKLAAEWLPDTILLDIELPLKNGYLIASTIGSGVFLLKMRQISIVHTNDSPVDGK